MVDQDSSKTAGMRASRRQFGIMGAMAAVAGFSHPAAASMGRVKAISRPTSVSTPNGSLNATFIAPENGQHRGLVMWGQGAASATVAKALAEQGWSVLLVAEPAGDAQQINRQARALIEWLDTQPEVASTGKSSQKSAAGLGYGYTLRSVSAALPRLSFASAAQRRLAAGSATLFAVPDSVVPRARLAGLQGAARQTLAA
jgi:hypothetical protein